MTDTVVRCANCSKSIKVKIFSAGLSDVEAFTCVRDSTVLIVSGRDKTLASLLGGYPRTGWSERQFKMVEDRLIKCPCGGTFAHDALTKCPNCGTVLNPKLAPSEFVVVGEMINGEKTNPWQYFDHRSV